MGKGLYGTLLFLLLVTGIAGAQFEDPDISGLLINNTRTRIGQEFYRQFCAGWGEVHTRFSFNINIREIPDARWGSMLVVEINDRQAFRKILGPRTAEMEQEVEKAILAARSYLVHLIRTNGNLDTDDLKGDGY